LNSSPFSSRSAQHDESVSPETLTWTNEIAPGEMPDPDVRIDMVERLAIVGEAWCVETLELALREKRNPHVKNAAGNALIVIGARRQ
jgi:hypothetical protein